MSVPLKQVESLIKAWRHFYYIRMTTKIQSWVHTIQSESVWLSRVFIRK